MLVVSNGLSILVCRNDQLFVEMTSSSQTSAAVPQKGHIEGIVCPENYP
jgi:hypothetical protein